MGQRRSLLSTRLSADGHSEERQFMSGLLTRCIFLSGITFLMVADRVCRNNFNGPFLLQSDKTKSPDRNFTIRWLSYTVRSDIEERVAEERSAWKHTFCVRELSYAINFRTATAVSHTFGYGHGFRVLLNFVLSAKSTKYTKLNRIRKFLRLQ